jgi:four helix bundle protein
MTPLELRTRAQEFAVQVQEIANQLHDSAHSAASNYRAVCRARTPKEFISKLCVVVEESDEAQGWLEGLVETGKGGPEAPRLLQEATELVAIFTASKHTWLRNEEARKERARQEAQARRQKRKKL